MNLPIDPARMKLRMSIYESVIADVPSSSALQGEFGNESH
jgi:hypothetical protein